MTISIILARSANKVIGNNNKLPWYLPADLKHFKVITEGHPVIMGRKTFESLNRPLPNRYNIVITRNKDFQANGVEVVFSLSQAIEIAKKQDQKEVFIIGGGKVYKEAMPYIHKIYLTEIKAHIEGDTFFDEIDSKEWVELRREDYSSDEKNKYNYAFIELVRK